MLALPTFQKESPRYSYSIVFENQRVLLSWDWNTRNNCFHVSVTGNLGVTIYGIKVVPNWPLLRQKKGFTAFRGEIVVLPIVPNPPAEITYDNFGTSWQPYLLTPEELVEWETANGSN